MFSANKAILGGLGPALTTILLMLDEKMGWGFGAEFWGAVLTVGVGLAVYFVPNLQKPTVVDSSKSGA